jgi:hypothetical protein
MRCTEYVHTLAGGMVESFAFLLSHFLQAVSTILAVDCYFALTAQLAADCLFLRESKVDEPGNAGVVQSDTPLEGIHCLCLVLCGRENEEVFLDDFESEAMAQVGSIDPLPYLWQSIGGIQGGSHQQ